MTITHQSSANNHGDSKNNILLKIVIVGDSGVGKSCLLLQYTENEFYHTHTSTIGVDFKITSKKLNDGRIVKAQLWDTAGQESYHSIVTPFFRCSNGIILVFDLTNLQSFLNISKWTEEIKDLDEKVPILLIGNKSDLINDKKIITDEEIKRIVKRFHFINFIETSAKNSNNVKLAFETMIDYISTFIK
ncbi:hypothetical protein ABK040_014154 [Willaertia magna]